MFSNLDLAYLIREVKPVVVGSFLKKVQRIGRGAYRLRLSGPNGSHDLIVLPGKAVYLSEYKLKTVKEDNIVLFLRKHLSNRRVVSFSQHEFDRIAVLVFEGFSLVIELFSKGNMVLVDSSGKILMPMRSESWADRTVRRGHDYVFPKSALDPSKASLEEFSSFFSGSDPAIRVLLRNYNAAGPHLEEVFFLAGLDKSSPASSLSQTQIRALFKEFKGFYSISDDKKKPALYAGIPSPVALPSRSSPLPYSSFNKLVDELLSHSIGPVVEEAKKSKLSKEENVLSKQLEDRARFIEEAESNSLKAELIYHNYQKLSSMLNEIRAAKSKGAALKDVLESLKSSNRISGYDLKKKSLTLGLRES